MVRNHNGNFKVNVVPGTQTYWKTRTNERQSVNTRKIIVASVNLGADFGNISLCANGRGELERAPNARPNHHPSWEREEYKHHFWRTDLSREEGSLLLPRE